jgi:carbonic anhydrase
MQKLVQGVHSFYRSVVGNHQEFFANLEHGQNPQALFITCSDSRINPNLITQTDPGELFIIRNVGNLIPPYGASQGCAEEAAIEYAISALKIKDIIVCGHTQCGAMQGLSDESIATNMPRVARWLSHADATKRIVQDLYPSLDGDARLTVTVEENVLVQLENLRTHPVIASGLASGKIKLHAWVYKISTGQVFAFDPERGQFDWMADENAARTGSNPLQAPTSAVLLRSNGRNENAHPAEGAISQTGNGDPH